MDNHTTRNTIEQVLPLTELLTAFAAWQRQRGFSPATVRRRRISITSLARWIAPAHISAVTTIDVEEWLDTFSASRTRHAYRSDCAVFFRWAVRRHILAHDPTGDTDPIKVPRSLPRPVPPELVAHLIATAPEPWVGTAIGLAAYAGLRCSEVANITGADLSLHTRPPVLAVRNGKGGKDRLVPIHPQLVPLLDRRTDGRLVDRHHDTIGHRVAAHLRACGVDASMHQLRHTFGTELARVTNGNLILTGRLMGHESPDTTKGYVGWSGGDASAAVVAMFGDAA